MGLEMIDEKCLGYHAKGPILEEIVPQGHRLAWN
jgi:hypothetical protein